MTRQVATATELDQLDGLTAGTATASKALVVDTNRDIANIRNATVTNLDAGASGTAGTVDVFPSTASRGKLAITCTAQTGDTTVTLTAGAMGQATTVTIPDPGANADVVVTAGAQTIAGAKSFTGAMTTTDGVASGTARKVGGGAFAQTAASAAITGTTETETNFSETYSLPANTLKAGTRVKIRAQGIHTATTGTETHTILLKLGSTTLASKASIDPADNDIFYCDFEFVCRTAGASGTIVGCGLLGAGVPGTAQGDLVHLASTTVDTTAAQVIAVAIDRQASATDADSARLDFLSVDVIG